MKGRRRPPTEDQLTLYDEASLFSRLSEQQGRLVSGLLAQAARTSDLSQENVRLASDLAGSLDRLQEVHHRIRNHLQTVTGLLSAQQVAERSPGARRALRKSVARLTSIAAIHDLLARDPTSGDLRLPDLAQQLSRHLLSQAGAEQRLRIQARISPITLAAKQATAFVLILTELLCNAIEHAFPNEAKGDIIILLKRHDDKVLLEVRDTGCGLPPDFDLERTSSLGLHLVVRLAERDLGGCAAAHNAGGACFRVTFPIAATGGRASPGGLE
jgi:two-component sensor histidine kinase